MDTNKTDFGSWFGFIPRKGRGVIGFGAVVVFVFVLGLLISGGDSSTPATESTDNAAAVASASEPTLWTCSMHPQIRLPKPGKCPICFMDLIPLQTSGHDDLGPRELRLTDAARQLARIQTTLVRRATAATEVRMVGKITYDETRRYSISAWVPGRLDSLYVDYVGERVRRGDPLAYIYSPQLLSAQEELVQALQAVSSLSNSGSILKSTAQATVEAARKKLSLYGLSDDQIKAIESSGKTSDHMVIYAPAGGIVIVKKAQEGDYVSTGAEIYNIADLSRLWVVFDAYETDLPWLREGQQVEFTTPSFPGEKFTAKITFIEPLVDQKTRTVAVRAMADNRRGHLKPDMFVSGVVKADLDKSDDMAQLASTTDNATHPPLVIPASAPLITGTRAVVYVEENRADSDIVYQGREITLGPRVGDYYIVTSGLKEGERVVTNGAFKIDSELQIHAKQSMMSPDDGESGSAHNHGEQASTPNEKPNDESDKTSATAQEISAAAREGLTPVYDTYLQIQQNLADDDFAAASTHYYELQKRVGLVDMELFSGDSHKAWMGISANIFAEAKKGANAATIDESRTAFRDLSKAIIKLHDTFGHGSDKTLYLTFCPMAFGGEGGYWIQAVDTIYNPFYGSQMLRCGEIRQTYPPYSQKDE